MSDCRNPHLSAYDRAAQEDMERSRAADSREKIEADKLKAINGFLREHGGAISWNDELVLMSDEWLDRQAAITERDVLGREWNYKDTCDSLQEQVDELEAELNRTCTLAYDGKWLTCSECGESLQWFGVRTVYKTDGKQERALGVEGVRYCPFCGARIEIGGESE